MDAATDLDRRLAGHPSIVFGLLFGPRGRGDAHPGYDRDIAVYLSASRPYNHQPAGEGS